MTASVPTDRLKTRDVAVLALAAALFAALGNTFVVLFQRHILQRPGSASPEFAFLAPIGYITVFVIVAVPLLLLNSLLPARVANRFVPAALAATASYALLALITYIHPLALGLVALAIGAQVGAAFGRNAPAALSAARWLAGVCGAAVVLTAAATTGVRQFRTRRLADARMVADTSAPNIILLILDTVRAKNLSVYGYPRATSPVLERLAAAGVAFEACFSTGTFSGPSHVSMLTGLWGSQTGANFTSRIRGTPPTLPAILNAHGYESGAFVGNAAWAGRNVGLGRGFAHYVDFPRDFRQAVSSTTLTETRTGRRLLTGLATRQMRLIVSAIRQPDFRFTTFHEARYSTPDLVEQFWRWRDGVRGHPYFAMINFMDAHEPYDPPDRFRTMFGDGSKILDRYDGAIAYLDSIVGGVVDGLGKRGELERTVLVVTADHGELLGEHGIEGHSKSVYPRAVRVPLIFVGGLVPRGIRAEPQVSLRDLAKTILDIAGVREDSVPGSSLREVWVSGSNRAVSPVVFEAPQGKNVGPDDLTRIGPIKGAADSTWYYIRYADRREEVFRWRTDSLDATNLIGTAEGRAAADRLLQVLQRELGGDSSLVYASKAGKR